MFETFFAKVSLKISDVIFQGKTLYWVYLRNYRSDWRETKRRCIGWILGELCDLDFWPHPWPWALIFKIKLQNRFISEIVIWMMWNRKKSNKLYTGWLYALALWPHPWPWPCSFKVKIWNRNGMADWHGTKGVWFDRSWPWPWPIL